MSDQPKRDPVHTGPIDEKMLDELFEEMLVAVKQIRDGSLPEYISVTDVEGGGERLTLASRSRS